MAECKINDERCKTLLAKVADHGPSSLYRMELEQLCLAQMERLAAANETIEKLPTIADAVFASKWPTTKDGVVAPAGTLLYPPKSCLHEPDGTEIPLYPAFFNICTDMDFPCGKDKDSIVYQWSVEDSYASREARDAAEKEKHDV